MRMLQLLGILFLVIGIVFLIFDSFNGAKVEWAGVVMIGPIPIAVGSNKNIVIVAMVIAVILFLIFLLLPFINKA